MASKKAKSTWLDVKVKLVAVDRVGLLDEHGSDD